MSAILLPTTTQILAVTDLSADGNTYCGGEHRFGDSETLILMLASELVSGATGGLYAWIQGYSGADWFDLPLDYRQAGSSTVTAGAVATQARNLAQGIPGTRMSVGHVRVLPSTPIRAVYATTSGDRVFNLTIAATGKKL